MKIGKNHIYFALNNIIIIKQEKYDFYGICQFYLIMIKLKVIEIIFLFNFVEKYHILKTAE